MTMFAGVRQAAPPTDVVRPRHVDDAEHVVGAGVVVARGNRDVIARRLRWRRRRWRHLVDDARHERRQLRDGAARCRARATGCSRGPALWRLWSGAQYFACTTAIQWHHHVRHRRITDKSSYWLLTNTHARTHAHTHTHTNTHNRLTALCPGQPGWAGTRKVKPNWILLKQETVSGSGISWAKCKSAPRSRQITTPAPHHSVFYRPDALPAAQPTASKHWRHKALITHTHMAV